MYKIRIYDPMLCKVDTPVLILHNNYLPISIFLNKSTETIFETERRAWSKVTQY
jgi:hypothetical protein